MDEEIKTINSEIPEDKSWELDEAGWDLIDDNDFANILKTMYRLHKEKQSDYGNSFDKTMEQFGFVSALVRLNDKINRLNNIYNKNNIVVANESVEDTLLDLANYCVLALNYFKRHSK